MSHFNLSILISFFVVFLLTLSALKSDRTVSSDSLPSDSLSEDRARHLNALRLAIKGKEQMPSDSVFKNIQMFKGVPAGRLLAIMDLGFSQSLGVSCGHCHNTMHWDSEEKPQKQIAREMSKLVGQTNTQLRTIQGLQSQTPTINCTTCHRGSIKPALNLSQTN